MDFEDIWAGTRAWFLSGFKPVFAAGAAAASAGSRERAKAASIDFTTVNGPSRLGDQGGFAWDIGWKVKGSGYIVQKVTINAEVYDNNNTKADYKFNQFTNQAVYYEVWQVVGSNVYGGVLNQNPNLLMMGAINDVNSWGGNNIKETIYATDKNGHPLKNANGKLIKIDNPEFWRGQVDFAYEAKYFPDSENGPAAILRNIINEDKTFLPGSVTFALSLPAAFDEKLPDTWDNQVWGSNRPSIFANS